MSFDQSSAPPHQGVRLQDLVKQTPGGDINEVLRALEANTDAAAALLASAQVDLALEEAITDEFLASAREKDDHLFGGSAPLSSTTAKIHLCYSLGIFGPITRGDLLSIQQIRNIFAHARVPLSFTTEAIKGKCFSLKSLIAYHNSERHNLVGLLPNPSNARITFINTCLGITMMIGVGRKIQPDGKIKWSINMGEPQLP